MYSILIKEKNNQYRFLTVKKEVMKEELKEVTDTETNEVKTETVQVPTGEYAAVRYETDDKEELEAKCIELLGTYNKQEFMPINTEPYEMDLVWNSDEGSNGV